MKNKKNKSSNILKLVNKAEKAEEKPAIDPVASVCKMMTDEKERPKGVVSVVAVIQVQGEDGNVYTNTFREVATLTQTIGILEMAKELILDWSGR